LKPLPIELAFDYIISNISSDWKRLLTKRYSHLINIFL